MASVYDVDASDLIEKAAEQLESMPELKQPDWAIFVKTGLHKERPPINKKWWYTRLASILRAIYVFGPVGTQTLRRRYGGRKNRGMEPERTFKGSGSIARKALQGLQKAGLVIFVEKGLHKGRIISPKGKSLLDKIAGTLYKEEKKNKPKIEYVEQPVQTPIAKPVVIAPKPTAPVAKPAQPIQNVAKPAQPQVQKPVQPKQEIKPVQTQ